MLHCLGDFRAAIEHCRRAIELGPPLPESHLHLGNALLALNALFEAEAAYDWGFGLTLQANALYSAPKFTSVNPDFAEFVGSGLPGAPRWSGGSACRA